MKKIVLHIDMNSYFASVEQQANPFLRGKPVGVCAYLSKRGCIIASSKEAKAVGIKTGCIVEEALRLDPNVILVENEPAKYRSTTERIFKILSEYTDTLEPYSIDEAFLDLSGWVRNFKQAENVGRELAARIKAEVGEWLSASVGVSCTKFLAKFASDIGPKGGTLTITRENLDHYLRGRALTDAWGIGEAMAARLKFLGVNDLLELKNYSQDKLRRTLGRYGYYLWADVNGLEISRVSPNEATPKSVGHSYCLPKKTADKKYLCAVMYKLCEKTGRRLRDLDMEAGGISVYGSYIHGGPPSHSHGEASGFHKSRKTAGLMFTTEEIAREAVGFLETADLIMPVRMLAVSVSRLVPVSSQMNLFEDNLAKKDLSRALDKINDKYGEYTVVRGSMFGLEEQAKDRIGYRKTVSWQE